MNPNIINSDIFTSRRQNTVNNMHLCVNDVNELPGINYSEWIKICKSKLILRESSLLNIRIARIQSTTNTEIESFYNSESIKDINKRIKYIISPNISKHCFDNVSTSINIWTGIDLNKRTSSTPYTTFREYFIVAKKLVGSKKSYYLWLCFMGTCIKRYSKVYIVNSIK
eukprot:541433_1